MATGTHKAPNPRKRPHLSYADYSVACVCPLAVELAPLRAMLDAIHEDLPAHRDQNAYVLGEIGKHNVVIAVLSGIGNNHSGIAATQIRNDFPAIRFVLLVGIGGGVPSAGPQKVDSVRLGDVVVSQTTDTTGGVVQFDRGKRLDGDVFVRTGCLDKPPAFLSAAVEKLKAKHWQEGNQVRELISDMTTRYQHMKPTYTFPGTEQDQLFESDYPHTGSETCQRCDASRTRPREERSDPSVKIHYGIIGSSNCVIKSAVERDSLREEYNITCVEMEAAGLIDAFPSCLVIRGICDYSDSHKNKQWQPFAAAAAAAYAKELLLTIPSLQQRSTHMSMRMSPECYGESSLVRRGNDDPDHEPSRPAPAGPTVYETLFESLPFARMDSRLLNIARPLSRTCQWIFKEDAFKTWLAHDRIEDHHGFLWIKGKPGSGKSTVMWKVLRTLEGRKTPEITLSYFFNARAPSHLEKSVIGMYRSLVHQLLQRCPRFRDQFSKLFATKVHNDIVDEWTKPELQGLLIDVIESLGDQGLNILIDALDEGDEGDIREMIAFLEDCSLRSVTSRSALRICLSSRHYPHISIRRGLHLIMEQQDGQGEDIELYVRTKLANDQDQDEDLEALRQKVCQKSSRVFLWVVLVIRMLKPIHDRGGQLAEMEKCLKDIPETLDGVFAKILSRNSDAIDESILLLQWVLFAIRSLSPVELYLAARSGPASSLGREQKIPSDESVNRYLLNCSRGLTEVTKSKPPVVQFIHESVREFLVKDNGLAKFDETLADDIEGRSHDILAKACFHYFDQCLPPYQGDHFSPGEAPIHQGGEEISRALPFSDYAITYIFTHANIAEANGISQQHLLRQFQDAASSDLLKWAQLRNTFKRARIRRYTADIHLLYILAENDLRSLVKTLIEDQIDVNAAGQRYGNALMAACVTGHFEMATLLIQNGAVSWFKRRDYKSALLAAIRKEDYSMLDLLVRFDSPDKSAILSYGLFKTIQLRAWGALQFLLDAGAPCNHQNKAQITPLYKAALEGELYATNLLIDRGADVNAQGGHYGNALRAAAYQGHDSIARLLIERGADFNAQGGPYGNALQAAAYQGHDSIARLLIDRGADVNAQGGYFGNALQAAVVGGNETIARLLIERGADVNAQGGYYDDALRASLAGGKIAMTRLLLENGADANSEGVNQPKALQMVVERGGEETVRLLIKHGVDINARQTLSINNKWDRGRLTNPVEKFSDKLHSMGVAHTNLFSGINALEAAIMGHESERGLEMVELLLENGADVNSRGPSDIFPTAIHLAALFGAVQVTELLIKYGADIHVHGGPFGNALRAAQVFGNREVAALLERYGGYEALTVT